MEGFSNSLTISFSIFRVMHFGYGNVHSYYGKSFKGTPVDIAIGIFLNQARAGRKWFIEITFVRDVFMRACACVCVCVRPRGY